MLGRNATTEPHLFICSRPGDPRPSYRLPTTPDSYDDYQQRCGREVRIDGCDVNYETHEFIRGVFKGTMEMSNGGAAKVEWTLSGWCSKITVHEDKANGVDYQYMSAMWDQMRAGAFDLVPKMLTKEQQDELKQCVEELIVHQIAPKPSFVQNLDKTIPSQVEPGDDSCDCGATKHGWGHSHWCSTQK